MLNRQRGVALIAVLLIFALISILAAGMINRQRLQISQSINVLGQSQAYQIALGAEMLAMWTLNKDFIEDKRTNQFIDTDEELSRSIVYAELNPPFSVEGQLDDLQGRLNVNALVDQTGKVNKVIEKRFQNLLFQQGVTDFRLEVLIDWLDPNDQVDHAGGAEDEAYLIKNPPYRAGNGPLTNVSELMLLEGMTRENYEKIEPYVTALPPTVTAINVNTAPAGVLRTISDQMTQAQAEAIVKNRAKKGYESVSLFLSENQAIAGQPQQLDVKSEYFQLTARAIFDDRTSRLVSVIHRDNQGKLKVLRRDQGQKYAITKQAVQLQE